MVTKTTSHWMGVEFQEAARPKRLLLRLDKKDYQSVIAAAEARTGKPVVRGFQSSGPENVTKGSRDLEEVVDYPLKTVQDALRTAMETQTWRLSKEDIGYLECARPRGAAVLQGRESNCEVDSRRRWDKCAVGNA